VPTRYLSILKTTSLKEQSYHKWQLPVSR